MKYITLLLLLISLSVTAAPLPKDVLSTDAKAICYSGYSATVRNVSVAKKKLVYKKAGIDYNTRFNICSKGFEVDHIIPLSIGGSNDLSNLQAQSYCGPRNALDKDKDENRLHKAVCSGKINILNAQADMRAWK